MAMTRGRKRLVTGAVLVLVLGHLYEVARQHEHWPFSNYPMFAHRNTRDPVSRIAVFGVPDAPGGAAAMFELTDPYTGVYKNFRFHVALGKMLRGGGRDGVRDPDRLAGVLDAYFPYYEQLRSLGYHDGPPLAAVRLYRLEWDFHPQAANRRDPPRMTLVFERRRPGGVAPGTTQRAAVGATLVSPLPRYRATGRHKCGPYSNTLRAVFDGSFASGRAQHLTQPAACRVRPLTSPAREGSGLVPHTRTARRDPAQEAPRA